MQPRTCAWSRAVRPGVTPLAVIALLAVSAFAALAPGVASARQGEEHWIEPKPTPLTVDVVNETSSDVNLRFLFSDVDHKGGITPAEFAGTTPLPYDSTATIGPGETSAVFAFNARVAPAGVTDPVPVGDRHPAYDAGYWVDVARTNDPTDRAMAKMYRRTALTFDGEQSPENPFAYQLQQPMVVKAEGTGLRVTSEVIFASSFGAPKVGQHPVEDISSKVLGHVRIVIRDPSGRTRVAAGDDGLFGRWDRDLTIGEGGWERVDAVTERWREDDLDPLTDYWFRCYDPDIASLSINGAVPTIGDEGGFWVTSDDRGRVTALRMAGDGPQSAVCDVHVAVDDTRYGGAGAARVRQVSPGAATADSAARPIYKVTVPAVERVYADGVPDNVRIPPYTVEGRDATGAWAPIGVLLPQSAPAVDASRTKLTYGAATMYFQNRVGQSITHLRFRGAFRGVSGAISLADAPQPDVSADEISSFEVRASSASPGSAFAVEGNGSAQEGLRIAFRGDDGEVIAPSDPQRGSLYDSLYYRGEDGRLVTGLYDPTGYTAVSDFAGATQTSGFTCGAEGGLCDRAFLSTTDVDAGAATSIVPHVDLGTDRAGRWQTDAVRFSVVRSPYSMEGVLTEGLTVRRGGDIDGAHDPATSRDGGSLPAVYRINATVPGAVAQPLTVAVTQYRAITAIEDMLNAPIKERTVDAIPLAVTSAGGLKATNVAAHAQLVTVNAVSRSGTQLTRTAATGFPPVVAQTAVVALGDSFISGEAGRWYGNSKKATGSREGTDRAYTGFASYDKSRVYVDGSHANGCHRSDVSEVRSAVSGRVAVNLACSGAKALHVLSSERGGVSFKGERPQLDQLKDVRYGIDAIIVSIGGNDLGFAEIIERCVTGYITSTRFNPDVCNRDEHARIEIGMAGAMRKVRDVLIDVRRVMSTRGKGIGDYRLILQSYPSPVPRASDTRYVETGTSRMDYGCPVWDVDLDWARDVLVPMISSELRRVALTEGVEFLDVQDALDGHEPCAEQAVDGGTAPPERLEWVRALSTGVLQGDMQESFHPNALGQQALGACLRQVLAADPGTGWTCRSAPGQAPTDVVAERDATAITV